MRLVLRGLRGRTPPSKTVRAYWWNTVPNFGDRLAPLLLERYAGVRCQVAEYQAEECEVVSIGSVLTHLPRHYAGIVCGSGSLYREQRIDLPVATVLGVRGPLSLAQLTHRPHDVAIGDPGLLAHELVQVDRRTHDLGILPHWTDTELAHDRRFFGKWSRRVIDPRGDPLQVVQAIGECRKLVTSSLHGLVLADAFGIPRRLEMSRAVLERSYEGGTYKFEDYDASVGVPFRVGEAQQAHPHRVIDRKHEIYDAYRAIAAHL